MDTNRPAEVQVTTVLPEELALRLLDEGLAYPMVRSKHDPGIGSIEVVLTVLSSVSSLVTLIVSRDQLAEFVTEIGVFVRRTGSGVTLERPEVADSTTIEELLAEIRKIGDVLEERHQQGDT